MEHQQAAAHHEEHPPTTIRQYIMIGVILAIITVIELALTEAFDLETRTLVVLLVALSSVKFAILVALFWRDHQESHTVAATRHRARSLLARRRLKATARAKTLRLLQARTALGQATRSVSR